MTGSLRERVTAALSGISNERVGKDIVAAGMIQDLVAAEDGTVTFSFLLADNDNGMLVRQARRAAENVDGVSSVKLSVTNPSAKSHSSHPPPSARPPTPPTNESLGRVLAISSGKGGVGKSTVASNLAIALAAAGHRVGLMDADVYGPNLPRMFGRFDRPIFDAESRRIVPLEAHGVKFMSLGLLVERDAPAIWRGPIIMKVIQQFLQDVEWGTLDFFLVDLPPGTGDAQLSLVQATSVTGALIVTTPQEMAVGDALRGARMFEKVGVPVLGIIENMSAFIDADTGKKWELFSSGGGQRLADELEVPLLGSVPLQPDLAELADKGTPILIASPDSPAALELRQISRSVASAAQKRSVRLPVING